MHHSIIYRDEASCYPLPVSPGPTTSPIRRSHVGRHSSRFQWGDNTGNSAVNTVRLGLFYPMEWAM